MTSSSAITVAELDGEDGQPGDGASERVDVARRRAADAVEQRAHREPVDQAAGGVLVDRREGELAVVDELHQDAARRDQHQRPNVGSRTIPSATSTPGGAIAATVTV